MHPRVFFFGRISRSRIYYYILYHDNFSKYFFFFFLFFFFLLLSISSVELVAPYFEVVLGDLRFSFYRLSSFFFLFFSQIITRIIILIPIIFRCCSNHFFLLFSISSPIKHVIHREKIAQEARNNNKKRASFWSLLFLWRPSDPFFVGWLCLLL